MCEEIFAWNWVIVKVVHVAEEAKDELHLRMAKVNIRWCKGYRFGEKDLGSLATSLEK